MKKLFTRAALALGLGPSLARAEENAVAQPSNWMAIEPRYINNDIPEVRGLPGSADLAMPSDPAAVKAGYLNLLQASETWGSWILASVVGMALLLVVFVLINGRSKLSHGFSGKLIERWTAADLAIHWFAGISCMVLILSGLVLGAGRFSFADWMTPGQWDALASGMVFAHNLFAWPFMVGAVLMVVKWARKQTPESCDAAWFASLGGYLNFGPFKGKHPDAGFANAGEKLWFWTFAIFGAVLIGSGLVLLFPGALATTKDGANLALVLHMIGAIVVGAFSVVHIFMATVMSEGGMENMVSGKCDENWARQHHRLWFEKVRNKA